MLEDDGDHPISLETFNLLVLDTINVSTEGNRRQIKVNNLHTAFTIFNSYLCGRKITFCFESDDVITLAFDIDTEKSTEMTPNKCVDVQILHPEVLARADVIFFLTCIASTPIIPITVVAPFTQVMPFVSFESSDKRRIVIHVQDALIKCLKLISKIVGRIGALKQFKEKITEIDALSILATMKYDIDKS